MTALVRAVARRSERTLRDATYTWRMIGAQAIVVEDRGRRRRDRLEHCLVVAAISATLIGGLISSVVASRSCCCSPPGRRTKILISQLAYEAVPEWLASHPGRACPSLAELAPSTNRGEALDEWGTPLQLFCAPAPSLAVLLRSAGPDRELGTEDDLVGQ